MTVATERQLERITGLHKALGKSSKREWKRLEERYGFTPETMPVLIAERYIADLTFAAEMKGKMEGR